MINFGIRQSFDKIEQIEDRYMNLKAPVEVAHYLIDNKWEGNVVLEYLFEFHDQMLNDLKILKAMQ